jgi:hypothetical protein
MLGGWPHPSRWLVLGGIVLLACFISACGGRPAAPRTAPVPTRAQHQEPNQEQKQERETPMLDQSRPPPPRVAPISHAGIRYEQVKNARSLGFEQVTGYLAAIEEASGKRLWAIKVYDNSVNPELESDVQETYFKSMELGAGARELQIINEAGKRFLVDLASQKVRAE